MKFDVQLASYLYENKLLTLEGIGTFTLDSKVSVPREQEKEIYYPIEGLSFVYNPKSASDEEVILYLVDKLHKIQPLIRSDLESYLSNVRQFINIGKPYTIEGIGTLSKNNQGIIEFTPGSFLPVKEELHPKRENQEHNYPARSQSSAGRVLVVILVVILWYKDNTENKKATIIFIVGFFNHLPTMTGTLVNSIIKTRFA